MHLRIIQYFPIIYFIMCNFSRISILLGLCIIHRFASNCYHLSTFFSLELLIAKEIGGLPYNVVLFVAAIGRMACDKNEVERSIRRLSMRLEGSGIDIYSIVKVVYGYDEQKTYSRRDIKKIFVMVCSPFFIYCCFACPWWIQPSFIWKIYLGGLNY